jgi:hypothetical protein
MMSHNNPQTWHSHQTNKQTVHSLCLITSLRALLVTLSILVMGSQNMDKKKLRDDDCEGAEKLVAEEQQN